MFKKLVNRFLKKGETPPPGANLREQLLDLDSDLELELKTGQDSKREAAADFSLESEMGNPQENKITIISQGLSRLAPEQLLDLAGELWTELGARGKGVLYRVLQDKGIVDLLLSELSGPSKPKNIRAAGLLGQWQVAEALPRLVERLASSDLGTSLAAVAALKHFPSSLTVPLLLETLEDPRRWPPARIAEIIGSYGAEAAPALNKAFRDNQGEVPILLMEILGQLRVREGVPAISTALSAAEPALRQKGAWAAGQLKGDLASQPRIVERLQELLHDPIPAVRAQALEALWQFDPTRTLPLAEAALQDEDGIVRGRAAGLLGERQDLPREIWIISGKKTLSSEDRRALEAWLAKAAAIKEDL